MPTTSDHGPRAALSARSFVFGDDRPFASCHASTLLPLADGRIMVAWFGGSHERHADVAIWAATRNPGGQWSAPTVLADEAGLPHWNPVLARSPSGRLVLFYKVGPDCMRWRTRVLASREVGATWSKPVELPALDGFPPGPVKNKPIALADGSWLAPTSRETPTAWDAAVTRSRDDGESWELAGPVPLDHAEFEGKGVIQPALWESAPGIVHMLLRSSAGRIYRSDSADSGRSWSAASPTELPNNNSGIDLACVPDGGAAGGADVLALCHNPVPASWGKRTPLVVSLSADNGLSWEDPIVLEDEDLPEDEEQIRLTKAYRPTEFSYPAIVADGTTLRITYTWKRARICYREITVPGPGTGQR